MASPGKADRLGLAQPRWLSSPVNIHAIQCARCFKWRVVPNRQRYEAIRENITERPWMCEFAAKWRPDCHCDLPADIEQDPNLLWAIDQPNLPASPPGWDRQIIIRTEGSAKFADVYYCAPDGTKLRSRKEIERFLIKYPDSIAPNTSLNRFSFVIPKPLPGVCPQVVRRIADKPPKPRAHKSLKPGKGLRPGNGLNFGKGGASESLEMSGPSAASALISQTKSEEGACDQEQETAVSVNYSPDAMRNPSNRPETHEGKRGIPGRNPPAGKRAKHEVKSERQTSDSARSQTGSSTAEEKPNITSETKYICWH